MALLVFMDLAYFIWIKELREGFFDNTFVNSIKIKTYVQVLRTFLFAYKTSTDIYYFTTTGLKYPEK